MRLVYLSKYDSRKCIVAMCKQAHNMWFFTRRFSKHDSLCVCNIKRLRSPIEISLVVQNILVRSLTYTCFEYVIVANSLNPSIYINCIVFTREYLLTILFFGSNKFYKRPNEFNCEVLVILNIYLIKVTCTYEYFKHFSIFFSLVLVRLRFVCGEQKYIN